MGGLDFRPDAHRAPSHRARDGFLRAQYKATAGGKPTMAYHDDMLVSLTVLIDLVLIMTQTVPVDNAATSRLSSQFSGVSLVDAEMRVLKSNMETAKARLASRRGAPTLLSQLGSMTLKR